MRSAILGIASLAVLVFPGLAAVNKPNIVYILVDDLGFADCGFNGGKDIRTPNIDSLSREGSVFKSYYVQPLCSATRAALMSGRFPVHNGIYGGLETDSKFGLPLDIHTLAQSLQEAGYTTAITGKWHLGDFKPAYLPTRRGFDHQYGLWYSQINYYTHVRRGLMDWHRDDKPLVERGYSTHLIAKEAVRVIESQPAGKPLFLYVPFNAVHAPFEVPGIYKEPYADLPLPRRKLAGMLTTVDDAVGEIVKALDQKKLRDNTLIVFSSDNGGVSPGLVTNNTPLRDGKWSFYEGGIRVSAFAVCRGAIPAGKSIEEPVHIVDWYPTLLRLAGMPPVSKLDGVDIWPLLTEGRPPGRDALLLCGTWTNRYALRMGDWKLLKNPGRGVTPGSENFELYNLAADISESKDLAREQPIRLKKMKERLESMLMNAVPPLGTGLDENED